MEQLALWPLAHGLSLPPRPPTGGQELPPSQLLGAAPALSGVGKVLTLGGDAWGGPPRWLSQHAPSLATDLPNGQERLVLTLQTKLAAVAWLGPTAGDAAVNWLH